MNPGLERGHRLRQLRHRHAVAAFFPSLPVETLSRKSTVPEIGESRP